MFCEFSSADVERLDTVHSIFKDKQIIYSEFILVGWYCITSQVQDTTHFRTILKLKAEDCFFLCSWIYSCLTSFRHLLNNSQLLNLHSVPSSLTRPYYLFTTSSGWGISPPTPPSMWFPPSMLVIETILVNHNGFWNK